MESGSCSSDTIVAPATPAGEGALAIVRLSGPDCAQIARDCLGGRNPAPRQATLGTYVDRQGQAVDQCIFLYYTTPASFTGEDMLELNTHGNPLIVQRIVEDLIARGCRAAEAGEFTRRAFLNGRMDLTQAEAVLDVIHARSERALQAAQRQLEGSVGRAVQRLLDRLLAVVAHIEAYIDFPEEDLPPEDQAGPARELSSLVSDAERLAATDHYAGLLQDGARTVIAGAPNAGKSSLLNALVGSERAIVSAEPGTTRDYIEERLMVGPYLLRIVDTAGLRAGQGEIEAKGIERSLQQIEKADVVLLVLDATLPSPTLPQQIAGAAGQGKVIVVLNKCDLPTAQALEPPYPGAALVRISALTGSGIDTLRRQIAESIETRFVPPGDDAVLVSARHAEALRSMIAALNAALAMMRAGEAIELAASELRSAVGALEQILGKIDNERMLDQLFASFCIGK